jgi:hypothetical protein
VEVDWPSRIAVQKLALGRPWLLLERDNTGSLALRRLLASRPRPTDASPASDDATAATLPAISIGRIAVDDGGLRVVDRAVSPPFAIDLQPARAQLEGLSTEDGKPARLDLRASVGPSAELILRGTLGRLGGPLSFDASGELREFAVPRTNPYLVQHVGWRTTEGRLTTKVQCRIDGDALSAKTDVRLSRLSLVRASAPDEAQKRVGLPLGLLTALLKDRRGDISLSFPVSGRLSDPRFDFRDTVWSAIRTVAVHAITLPVSWIGRVRFTPDSKIERIEVEPIPFVPGTATLTPDGEARTSRLTAFLDQLPAVRLALAAAPSSRDIDELRRRPLETAIDRAMRRGPLSRPEAIARLHAEQFPGQPVPERPEAAFTALLEARTLPASQVSDLLAARLVAVRDVAKRAGIDPARLPDSSATRRPGAVDSQVELEVVQPEASKTSGITEILRRLGISPRTAEPDR